MKRIMNPSTPNHEHEIADAIDKWVEAKRNLAAIKAEYQLATPFLFVALECIMNVGNAKMFYEDARIRTNDFQELLDKC